MIVYVRSPVNRWRPLMSAEESQKKSWTEERENNWRKGKIFWKCRDKIREEIKGQRKRKLFHGAWMRWHERSALWVPLAWGKPLEQKDKDGRVCAVPQRTCTQNMHQICSRAVHKQPTVYTSPQDHLTPSTWSLLLQDSIVLSNPVKQRTKWLISKEVSWIPYCYVGCWCTTMTIMLVWSGDVCKDDFI